MGYGPAMRTVLLSLALGCADSQPLPGKGAPTDDTGEPAGDDAGGDEAGGDDAGGDDDGGGGGGDDGSGEDTGDPPPPPPDVVRFIAMGDGGEGNADQYAVAATVKSVCDSKDDEHGPGCDFVLYLGDNFYDDGVESVDDDQFQSKFELPYADLDLPFYVVLGNHDYGEWSIWEWKGRFEVDYTTRSDKWTMPDVFYSFTEDHARFIGLDTNRLMLEDLWGPSGQDSWIQALYADTTPTWNIAFGHHPYISNGQHGNAGEYEGYDWLPIANGTTLKSFMDANLCGQVDLYLCGHDHNRQWLEPRCGTEFIVMGSAAKVTDLEGRGNRAFFEDDTVEGFVWIELRDNELTGEIWDRDGNLDYTRSFTR